MFIEGFIGHFTAHFLDRLSEERVWKIRLLPCKLIARSKEMRVSFSAFLRIAEGDSYLLVRSLHRNYAFGPFGGVYKYRSSARSELDVFEFRQQSGAAADDMKNDIRGYLPRRQILAFMRWFDHGGGREDPSTCLRRELMEELNEVGLAQQHPIPQLIQFRHVRRVHEGPALAAGQNYTQYRIFDIYDIAELDTEVIEFVTNLRSTAATHKDLMLVTAHEIIAGSSADGRMIGHHAGYLFSRKRVRPDEPMWVEPGRVTS